MSYKVEETCKGGHVKGVFLDLSPFPLSSPSITSQCPLVKSFIHLADTPLGHSLSPAFGRQTTVNGADGAAVAHEPCPSGIMQVYEASRWKVDTRETRRGRGVHEKWVSVAFDAN